MQILFMILTFLSLDYAYSQDQASTKQHQTNSTNSLKCEEDKSYLTQEITALKKSNNLSAEFLKSQPFSKLFVKRSCISSALAQVSAGRKLTDKEKRKSKEEFVGNNFVRCDDDDVLHDFQKTPCQSEDSIKLIHNSFETVTQCLKDYVSDSKDPSVQNEWVKLYFKMLTKESGLQNYVRSRRKAWGAGQIMPEYIQDFINFSKEGVQEHLEKSEHLVCRNLGEEILSDTNFKKFYSTKKKANELFRTCSFVGADDNQILRNLLVGFSSLKVTRTRARRSAFSNEVVKLSSKDQLQVELSLVPLAYNMGPGNLDRTITKALKWKKQISNPREYIASIKNAIPFVETKNYQFNIDKRFADVVKDSGQKSCFN